MTLLGNGACLWRRFMSSGLRETISKPQRKFCNGARVWTRYEVESQSDKLHYCLHKGHFLTGLLVWYIFHKTTNVFMSSLNSNASVNPASLHESASSPYISLFNSLQRRTTAHYNVTLYCSVSLVHTCRHRRHSRNTRTTGTRFWPPKP